MEPVVVDLRLPSKWKLSHFWGKKNKRVYGLMAAMSTRVFAFGIELITSNSKGIAVYIGPFWFAVATLKTKE